MLLPLLLLLVLLVLYDGALAGRAGDGARLGEGVALPFLYTPASSTTLPELCNGPSTDDCSWLVLNLYFTGPSVLTSMLCMRSRGKPE
jgi:hypothetical protein